MWADSLLTSHYPENLKLKVLNTILIINYPSFNTSLMQAVKGSNGGKHVARGRKLLWVEEGRGERPKAGLMVTSSTVSNLAVQTRTGFTRGRRSTRSPTT